MKKKTLIVTLLVSVMLFTSCFSSVSQDTTDSRGDTTVSQQTEAEGVTETETVTEQITYSDGVLRCLIYDPSALSDVIGSAEYRQAREVKLIFSRAAAISEDIIFDRPISFLFNSRVVSGGGQLVVKTDEQGEIVIEEGGVGDFDISLFSLDAPHCALTVSSNASLPEIEELTLYNNVYSCNGVRSVYGGTLADTVDDIKLSGSDETFLYKCGNELILYIPYSLSDARLSESSLTVECGCAYAFSDGLLTLSSGDESRVYKFSEERVKYDIPVLYIDTDGQSIESKTEYVHGTITLDASSSVSYSVCGVYTGEMGIRGRGNASWNTFPKKSYRIKLGEKAKLLGFNSDRDYALVSAYPDKTLIRNTVASSMASLMEHLEYTPVQALVDVFLNGEYIGVYTLSEKIEFGGGKLDYDTSSEDDTSYLCEVGWDYNDDMVYGKNYFDTSYIERIVIKEPEITEKYSSQVKFLMNYLKKTEAAIEALDGYEEYIDVDSLIDWMIILELTNNTESAFYRSCYFYKPAGGKLKFGPVWDFDMAFGNHRMDNPAYDTFVSVDTPHPYLGVDGTTWLTLLMKDESFVQRLKTRWNEKKDELLSTALQEVQTQSALVQRSQVQNFRVWDIMNSQVGESRVNYKVYNTYELQVQYLTDFINTRRNWMDGKLSEQ